MYEYNCKIVRVVDGDTVDVDIDLGFGLWIHNERIRLYGIDTPESRTRDLVEKKYGLFAKEFVQSHLPVGSIATLRTQKDKAGKFGRVLGEFMLRESTSDLTGLIKIETLNQLMIHFHIGVAYHGQSKDLIEDEHRRNRDLVDLNCLNGGVQVSTE
tara:strand:- start:16559 stop:17026 length:468 start_codon:yes stop_codon:yes gene_type:complete